MSTQNRLKGVLDSEFSLTEIFQLKLCDGSAFRVVLQEQFLVEALYTDSQFYSEVGQQFCIVFDIFYSKTGTEAVAESLYRVVEKQEMNGGQSISVLGNRAKIHWCFPPIVKLYVFEWGQFCLPEEASCTSL